MAVGVRVGAGEIGLVGLDVGSGEALDVAAGVGTGTMGGLQAARDMAVAATRARAFSPFFGMPIIQPIITAFIPPAYPDALRGLLP